MSTSQNRNELEAMLNEEDTLESRLVFHATNYAEREHFLDQKDSYQTSWLLPYLDRESLIEEPLLFLSLLHARTEYLPEEWTMLDNAQLKAVEAFEVLVSEFNPHYVVMTGAD